MITALIIQLDNDYRLVVPKVAEQAGVAGGAPAGGAGGGGAQGGQTPCWSESKKGGPRELVYATHNPVA